MTRARTAINNPSAFEAFADAFYIKSLEHKTSDSDENDTLIGQWAARIIPGSPPPPSARRSPSSFYGSPKPSRFTNIPFTPSPKPVSPSDLVAQGYTQFFVPLPPLRTASDFQEIKTIQTLGPLPQVRPRTKSVVNNGKKENDVSRRLRSHSLHQPDAYALTQVDEPIPAMPSHSSNKHASRKAKSTPQSRYGAIVAPGGEAGAFSLEQEVALAQFMGGGSQAKCLQRVVERHAWETGMSDAKPRTAKEEVYYSSRGPEGKDRRGIEKRERADAGLGGGVGGVYRDERGALWWDEDESLEFAGLLPEDARAPLRDSTAHNQDKKRRLLPRLTTKPAPANTARHPDNWVALHSPSSPTKAHKGHFEGNLRMSSAASISESSDVDLDLDPAFAVRPRDSTAFAAAPAFASNYSVAPERHLHRAPPGIEAFGGVDPLDARAAPRDAHHYKERRRPAPLTLPLPAPFPGPKTSSSISTSRPHAAARSPQLRDPFVVSAINGPSRVEREGRDEYFSSKFEPAAPKPTRPSLSKATRRGSLTSGFSALNVLGSKAVRRTSVDTPSPTAKNFIPNQCQSHTVGTQKVYSSSTVRSEGRSLKPKASRSKLAALFRRN